MTRTLSALIWTLSASLSFASFPRLAQAEVIGTDAIAHATIGQPAADARSRLAQTLARDDVAAGLRARGVDPAQALARVNALSDDEALALAQQIDAAPAGAGGVLGTIVFIFVLLLITDIIGFTKVYPFTRSIR
jgi:hypothetical protein